MLFRCQFHFIWFGSCSKYLPVCKSFIWHKHESFCKMWADHIVLRISCLSGRYRSHAQNLTPAALSFDVRLGKSFRNVKRRQQDKARAVFPPSRSFACSRSAPPVKCLWEEQWEISVTSWGQRWGQSGDCRRSGWAVTFPVTACCLLKGKLKRGRANFFFFIYLFISHQQFAALPVTSQETVALSLRDWQLG